MCRIKIKFSYLILSYSVLDVGGLWNLLNSVLDVGGLWNLLNSVLDVGGLWNLLIMFIT